MLLISIFNNLTMDMVWEYVGYLASAIVLASFVTTSVVKLRLVGIVGAALFSLYGFMIGSIPTGVMNSCIVLVNLYYLVRMKRNDDIFSAHPIRIENEFLNSFVLFNGRDIQKYFGNFNLQETDADVAILVYCNMTCAGLLVGKDLGSGKLRIDLDYATAEYRDCRVGKFLYARLSEMGFHTLTSNTSNEKHIAYLHSMGFEQQKDGSFSKNV